MVLCSEKLGFEERRTGGMVAFTRYNEIGCLLAISAKRQNALANCIWRGLRHSGSNRRGLPTTMTLDMAREVATLKRLRLWRNSMPRGASCGVKVVRDRLKSVVKWLAEAGGEAKPVLLLTLF